VIFRDDDTEEARAVREALESLGDHWDEAGHEGERTFALLKARVEFICIICGLVFWEESEPEPDA